MTGWAHLVSMPSRLHFDDLVAMLNSFSAPGDPSDPKQRTRARILRSAATLFEQHGYRRASIDEVARESGIAKGTVYLYFRSKAELLFHVIIEEKKRLIERFKFLFTDELPPAERLRRYLELVLVSLSESPLSLKLFTGDRELLLFLEELPADLREQMLAQGADGMGRLLDGVGHFNGLKPEERQERLAAFQGLLYSMGHLLEARSRTGLDLAKYARQLARIIVDGVGSP